MGPDFVPSLVVISLGGNDAGFSTIGAMCLAPGNCSDERDLWEKNLPKVGEALGNTFAQVRAEFPKSPVLAVPYPMPVYTDEDGNAVTCDQVALSKEDLGFIAEFLLQLNETVREAAESKRFYFLADMEDSLKSAHLQLCDPENDNRPGINFIGLRSVGGIAEQRFNPKNWYHNSLHPNERGHAAMLQVFENGRARNPKPDVDNPAADPTANSYTDAVSSTTLPPCDLIDDDQSTNIKCRTAGTDWAKGQVADSLLRDWWGLQFAIAVLAAWLLAVALFSWWKPWWTPRPAAFGGSGP